MKKNVLWLFSILCFLLHINSYSTIYRKSKIKKLVESNNAFAINFYLSINKKGENIIYSPFSISSALCMAYAGARGNTEKEMREVLNCYLPQDEIHFYFSKLNLVLNEQKSGTDIILNISNSLWAQKDHPFLNEYKTLIQKNYDLSIKNVDFLNNSKYVVNQINTWIEEKTNSRIKEMLSSSDIDPLTKLVIVNSIYFFGNWVKQFDEKLTTKKYFWVQPNDSILAPMMEQTHYFLGGADSIARFIELPYKGNILSMFIVLPNKGIELEKIEKNMTLEKLETWTTKLSSIKWHLSLPKYEFKTDIDLKNNLKKLGMSDAFNSIAANFSGMDGTRNLHISKALHQAYIKVDEKGTEAAAATALIPIYIIDAEPREFNVNCPFLFIIKENSTGSILFIGRVTNPTK